MAEYLLPLMMLAALIAVIFSGYPVAFGLAGIGIAFAVLGDLPFLFLGTVVSRIFSGVIANWLLLAVPLFVFMGLMLERSGMARNLLLSLERLLGGVRGGLACAVALLGIVLAASTGIIGASVVLMGVLALPVMLRNGYDKGIACGTVAASSTLGILIPPSIMLVLMGDILQISVGDLFAAAMLPGLALGGLYIIYILTIAILRPELVPAAKVQFDQKSALSVTLVLLRDLIGPVILIVFVLGSIIAGIATPTEAAAIGAAGALLLCVVSGQFNWVTLKETILETGLTTGMILFIAIGATCFSAVFKRLGGARMIEDAVFGLSIGPWETLGLVMLLIFFMGFVLEWIEISYIVLPLFAPVIAIMDFGFAISQSETLLWFALLVAVNLQASFLTPPFGYALFYLKGVVPPEISITDIYRSITPFVLLQLLGLALVICFPSLVLWLPRYLAG
ncbi:MAG: TRAP transporter large permease subunit [Rhodovibrionaceae bacterium]